MRRRLLIIVIGLITGLMVAFGLPLALISAEEESQELFISRANERHGSPTRRNPRSPPGAPSA